MSSVKDARKQAAVFAALAVESRVRIVQLLAKDTFCVGALSRLTGISAGAVSQHLRVLKSAGLVEPERRGYFVHYRLAPGAAPMLGKAVSDILKPKKGARSCVARKRSAIARRS
jgi:DNA-binding transcriptional ArsR family regulator